MARILDRIGFAGALIASVAFIATPLAAQSSAQDDGQGATQSVADAFAEIDALSDASVDAEAGIELARDQAERGEFLEAIATLERVLAQHPKSHEARLIHAVFLCRVDDPRGGLVEIDQLKEKHYGDKLLNEARAMCQLEEAE